jgi:hypothetical protein
MKQSIYIGIDPGGTSGGLFIISVPFDNDLITSFYSLEFKKSTEKDIYEFIDDYCNGAHTANAIIEKVHSMPGQGVSSSFKFGQNYGFLKGILTALGISYEEVTPQSWMKYYGMKKNKTESKTEWKKRLRQRAEQIFPEVKITANTADAILIAEYCRKISL